jgi:hypothetical protein
MAKKLYFNKSHKGGEDNHCKWSWEETNKGITVLVEHKRQNELNGSYTYYDHTVIDIPWTSIRAALKRKDNK